jgi:tetratricopeptide (TPR) repeat protein
MPDQTPSRPAADRNLLFGILALQMDFITRDALVAAMNTWVLDKAKSLAQILHDQGVLNADHRALLEALVQEHLKLHHNDLEQSLAAVSSIQSVRHDLEQIADPDLQASLAVVASAPAGPESTVDEVKRAGLRYRILRPHAKGGLGEVFVAEDQELHREVALKEIQPEHADNPQSRGRFVLEAEITGGLEHPGIVPVYGLGQYADGRPFYAMRFIKGDNLKEAVRRFHEADKPDLDPGERSLALRQLLRRFVDVCNAVAYAHSRGVLHRDLKPGNIMLGKYGETLLVDWGLAKPMDRPESAGADDEQALRPASGSGIAATQMGSAIGTPAYMSPEQAAGRLDLLGPASDVYSLGATLYTLLTGQSPFPESDKGEVLEKVRKGEFQRPRQIKARVPLPLEAICQKAMALTPTDRYPSALALSADIEHWLADEPVSAHREPLRARLGRWGRRHRAIVAGALVLLLTTTAGLGAGLYFVNAEKNRTEDARKGEAAQRELADKAAAESKAVLEFFQDNVLAAARPENQEGGLGVNATIRAAVDGAQPKIAGAFRDRPLAEASIRYTLGVTYQYLREDKAAIMQFERALELRTNQLGPDHIDTLYCMNGLAGAYRAAGQFDRALTLSERTVEKCQDKLGPDHPDTLGAMGNLSLVYWGTGKSDKSLALNEQILARIEEKYGADDPQTLTTMNNLALAYQAVGKPDKAVPLFEQTLAKRKEKLAPDHPDTLLSMNNLATAYTDVGKLDKAVPLFEQTLAKFKDKLGPDHADTLAIGGNLGLVYVKAGQPEKAVPLIEQTLGKLRDKLGLDHPTTLTTMNNLALAYDRAGQLDKALPLYEQTLAIRKEKLPPDHPHTLASMINLAGAYQQVNQFDKAVLLFEQALAKFKKLGPDHPSTLAVMDKLAKAYQKKGDYAQAEKVLRECLTFRQQKEPDGWMRFLTQSELGGCLLGQKKYADAEPLLLAGYEGMREREAAKSYLIEAVERLVQLYDSSGQKDKAAQWRKELEARKAHDKPLPPKDAK